jgi:hypothetical protein
VWAAIDPISKLLLAIEVGDRTTDGFPLAKSPGLFGIIGILGLDRAGRVGMIELVMDLGGLARRWTHFL